MNREIEVKISIGDSIEKAIEILSEKGIVLGGRVIQEDTVFCNYHGDYRVYEPGTIYMRLRKQNGEYIFTAKQPQTTNLDCIEYETKVENPEAIRGILELSGYHEVITIKKERRKAKHNSYEICLDNVEGLDVFVEVEAITDGVDSEKTLEELYVFAQTLGLDIKERVMDGYDVLMWEKENGIS